LKSFLVFSSSFLFIVWNCYLIYKNSTWLAVLYSIKFCVTKYKPICGDLAKRNLTWSFGWIRLHTAVTVWLSVVSNLFCANKIEYYTLPCD
jgi:hypothetical protein